MSRDELKLPKEVEEAMCQLMIDVWSDSELLMRCLNNEAAHTQGDEEPVARGELVMMLLKIGEG